MFCDVTRVRRPAPHDALARRRHEHGIEQVGVLLPFGFGRHRGTPGFRRATSPRPGPSTLMKSCWTPFSRRLTASPARAMRSSTLQACQSPYVGHVPPGAGIVGSVDSAVATSRRLRVIRLSAGLRSPPQASSKQQRTATAKSDSRRLCAPCWLCAPVPCTEVRLTASAPPRRSHATAIQLGSCRAPICPHLNLADFPWPRTKSTTN